jgi:hypothetical protein
MQGKIVSVMLILGLMAAGCGQASKPESGGPDLLRAEGNKILAAAYDSGFEHSHDTYNGLSVASDGRVYYVLCSQLMGVAGQMYSFDPQTQKIEHLGDLTEACGEKDLRAVAQGKSHVNFVEADGKLYFATHLGYYSVIDGMELPGLPTDGFQAYRGGHLLAFDMRNKTYEDLATAPNQEGILTMAMDTGRRLIFGLTWPSGILFRYDVARKTMTVIGPVSGEAEAGKGAGFRVICRSIVIDPGDGTAYFTVAEGDILRLKPGASALEKLDGADANLRKDYFGRYDVSTAGSMAYNWRQAFFYAPENRIYGVHGNSGYLFRCDPAVPRVEVLDRLTSVPSKLSGMFDQFSYGYLGFTLGPDGHTIYYLTGGPIYVDGQRVLGKSSTAMGEAKGLEDLHLVTYDITAGKYEDHGAVFFPDGQRPLYVNSIAVGKDGTVYTLGRITANGRTRTDLISFPGPRLN